MKQNMKLKALITFILCIIFNFSIKAVDVIRQQVTPVQNGDSILFIGNSFSSFCGPLPTALKTIFAASGSGINIVSPDPQGKGLGILQEYATWSSLGIINTIRTGKWKYVVIQAWRDAIDMITGSVDEQGVKVPWENNQYPANQDSIVKYFKILDAEVKNIGAVTILYAPHQNSNDWEADKIKSNESYTKMLNNVSCFYAPVLESWEKIRTKHPLTSTPDWKALLFAKDGGHQNFGGMTLDALTFYSIFTHKSAVGLDPSQKYKMEFPEYYNEFAAEAYTTAKYILGLNNSLIPDVSAPTTPVNPVASNILADNFNLTWGTSTDDIGVLGYEIYVNNVLFKTTPYVNCIVDGLETATTYAIKVRAYDSEGKTSAYSSLNVSTATLAKINFTGKLMGWNFTTTGGNANVTATSIAEGIANSASSGVINIGPTFVANIYNGYLNAFPLNTLGSDKLKFNLTDAITAKHYFTFNIGALPGCIYTIDSVLVRGFTQNNSKTFSLLSSVNGFAANNFIDSLTIPKSNTGGQKLKTFHVTGHTDLSSSVEFRVYVNATTASSAFGLGVGDAGISPDDLIIFGKVNSIGSLFPTKVVASNLTETGFTLSWNAADEAVSYEVFNGDISLGTTTTLSKTITGSSIGETYTLTVKAINSTGGISEPSVPLVVKIPDLTKPTTPLNLSVNGITQNSFILHWDACTDNVGIFIYETYRDGIFYGTTDATNMPIPYCTPGTSYVMTLRAQDAAGNYSDMSETITVSTLSEISAIEQANLNSSLSIFPNPAADFVNIRLSTQCHSITVSIVDMLGKIVTKSTIISDNGLFKVNIKALRNGLYLINVTDGKNNFMSKLNISR